MGRKITFPLSSSAGSLYCYYDNNSVQMFGIIHASDFQKNTSKRSYDIQYFVTELLSYL